MHAQSGNSLLVKRYGWTAIVTKGSNPPTAFPVSFAAHLQGIAGYMVMIRPKAILKADA
jgi:hypothetical protein